MSFEAPPPPAGMAWIAVAVPALAIPTLVAHNIPPSATFYNQAAAYVGWGGFLAVAGSGLPLRSLRPRGAALALVAALLLLAAAALASPLWTGLPWSLALGPAGTVLAAAWIVCVAAGLAREGLAEQAFAALAIGLVVAALAGVAIGLVQVYAPGAADGGWIAHSTIPGTAVGNLRQPNHLNSLLLWGLIAALWLGQSRRLPVAVAIGLAAAMLYAVVLTGSRTGMLGTVLLALWGLADRRLARPIRIALVAAPLVYGAFFEIAAFWAHQAALAFGGEAKLAASDISSSRFGIWKNTLALIAAHPWAGVGFGEFNFAWTLTPFPGRPVAFFDHTHNIVLQFVVELGVPLAAAVLALMLLALAAMARRAWAADDADADVRRAALAMVLMIGLHSLLEYPLWYSYFLFPAAFAFGLGLAARDATAPAAEPALPAVALSMLVLAGGLLSVHDYGTVARIFSAPEDGRPLAERIAEGQRSLFFSHHADYAAATVPEHPSEAMPAFDGAPHYLLDARLMMAWARALDESGDAPRARYLAQRLKEFHNEQAAEFFAPCDDAALAPKDKPFQCQPEPDGALGYADFRKAR